jgi:hypothetical protein
MVKLSSRNKVELDKWTLEIKLKKSTNSIKIVLF